MRKTEQDREIERIGRVNSLLQDLAWKWDEREEKKKQEKRAGKRRREIQKGNG